MKPMYDFFTKYGVAIFFGIGAILSLLVFVTISSSYPEGNPEKDVLFAEHSDIFNYSIGVSRLLIFACALAMIGSFVANTVINFKTSIKALVAFVVVVVLYFVTQGMGGTDAELLAHYTANEQEMGILMIFYLL